jgi:4-diphosphocytidyl-2-C-methyl-D-erythritol kinase
VLVLPLAEQLSTAEVYAQADRAELRSSAQLAQAAEALAAALAGGAGLQAASELLHNDLQRAALALCPQIERALEQARRAGAEHALVSGSGPTVLGLFRSADEGTTDGPARAAQAAAALAAREPAAIAATPVQAQLARALPA